MVTTAFSRFPPRLQAAIVSRLGWTSLRPVQELAGHAILDGKNVVILAPTAGGKTEASLFPVIAHFLNHEPAGVGAIYLAPIKALLNNQAERLGTYTEMVGLKRSIWHGDIKTTDKRAFIKDPSHILMTTPESLEVMLLSAKVPLGSLFQDLRAVVIDEIHAFAGSDRGSHLLSVLERIGQFTTNDIQRIGLSATIGNPEAILTWLQGSSQRLGEIIQPPKETSPKEIYIHHLESHGTIAQVVTEKALNHKSLFFCGSRSLSESIAERLRNRGIDVFVHHSSVSLEERAAAEARFQHGTNACIVCTSTLELGIDVGDLDFVFQANAPSTVSSFLQRLGRTGRRAGQRANTTFLCENSESVLQSVAIIELARSGWVESVPIKHRAWPVLVHQLFALTLQFGAISAERCWEHLRSIPDFADITPNEYDRLIQHLIQEDYLFSASGLLSMGQTGERIFGRKNFMELYAVFSSPQLYKVHTKSGATLGSLEQTFVDKLVPEISSFLLAGRGWVVQNINNSKRSVLVSPAPRGKKPSWGGFVPQILSYELCQKMKEILLNETPISYLSPQAQTFLTDYRTEIMPQLQENSYNLHTVEDQTLWWTFAGGQINHALKYGLQIYHDWKVSVDNLRLKIESDRLGEQAIIRAIKDMSNPEFWEKPETQKFIVEQLPEYRLSKFQRVLPQDYSLEMIQNYLVDIKGAKQFLLNI